MSKENRLIKETSPYLKSHADNPVDWYPWGEEALKKAEQEDKPLIVSSGYSACHWCHVMAHESFEDQEVADFMNENFISIKIDREERPDLDKIYMDAAMITSGQGGWPLNAITLPDGRPFFGGTYFRKSDWLSILDQVIKLWKKDREKIYEQAFTVTRGLSKDPVPVISGIREDIPNSHTHKLIDNLLKTIDKKKGGLKGQMKFPFPSVFSFLLEFHSLNGDAESAKELKTTLDRMSTGGIYDHVAGGFARYSVDPDWFIPHFEKMLYDNGLLTSLYAQHYLQTLDEHSLNTALKTGEFITKHMMSDDGGFYSSYDADSEGVEGLYYIWTYDELVKVLGDAPENFLEYFSISEEGNWEDGRNILHAVLRPEKFAENKGIDGNEFRTYLEEKLELLNKKRADRVPPALDNKIISAWNGMALKGLTDLYLASGDNDILTSAVKNGDFILDNLCTEGGKLVHSAERRDIPGFLDDYAFIISGFISLYQTDHNEKWLKKAVEMIDESFDLFFNSKSGFFYYTSDTETHLARKTEIHDNVIPSSNSVMAENLFIIGTILGNTDYLEVAEKMVKAVSREAMQGVPYYSNWSRILLRYTNPPGEVVITGPDFQSIALEIKRKSTADTIVVTAEKESELSIFRNRFSDGENRVYICRNRECSLPVSTVSEALDSLNNRK